MLRIFKNKIGTVPFTYVTIVQTTLNFICEANKDALLILISIICDQNFKPIIIISRFLCFLFFAAEAESFWTKFGLFETCQVFVSIFAQPYPSTFL